LAQILSEQIPGGQATKADIFWFFFLAAQQKKNSRPEGAIKNLEERQ